MSTIGPMLAASGHLGIMLAERLLVGVTAERFARFAQPGGIVIQSNHPAFVFGHLSLYPARVLAALGLPEGPTAFPEAYPAIFGSSARCQDDPDGTIYPPMTELVGRFMDGQRAALSALERAPDDLLTRPNPAEGRMKVLFPTVGSALSFYISGHVQNHLGQFSVWRRAEGMPPA